MMMSAKKILLIDTNYPINSRNQRIVDSLKVSFGTENVRVVAWNRSVNKSIKCADDIYLYSHPSPLGDKLAKLKSLWGFRNFIKDAIKAYNPTIIIASHWDSLLMAASIKEKNQVLIYENLDMPSGNSMTRSVLKVLERLALKRTDAISYASRFYPQFYSHFKGNHILLENKIFKGMAVELHNKQQIESTPLKIMFNGAIRYKETMLNLFNAIGNNPNIHIYIYGYPAGKEGEDILSQAESYRNITYMGAYKYNEIPELYSKVDLVWGVYPANDFNVKYAISNKFHESIAYGIPGIFAKDTMLGELVETENIGFSVDAYSIDDIKKMFDDIVNNKIMLQNKKNRLYNVRKKTNIDWDSEVKTLENYINGLQQH